MGFLNLPFCVHGIHTVLCQEMTEFQILLRVNGSARMLVATGPFPSGDLALGCLVFDECCQEQTDEGCQA